MRTIKYNISSRHQKPDTIADIHPAIIPIFPLANVLMLPYAKLALNIFEPRYLEMVEYALAHNRAIGMVQTRLSPNKKTKTPPITISGTTNGAVSKVMGNALEVVLDDLSSEQPAVYKTGCLGRIISFEETGDGRFGITLIGVSRFTITEELPQTLNFRLVHADYGLNVETTSDATVSPPQRTNLINTVKEYLKAKDIQADWSSIEQAADLDLVTSLAMLCPFNAGEKQALLECNDILEISHLLVNIMTLSLHGDQTSKKPIIH